MRPKFHDHAVKDRVSKRNLYAAANTYERLQVCRYEVREDAIKVTRENDVNKRRIGWD
jgi:hypothetical protein